MPPLYLVEVKAENERDEDKLDIIIYVRRSCRSIERQYIREVVTNSRP